MGAALQHLYTEGGPAVITGNPEAQRHVQFACRRFDPDYADIVPEGYEQLPGKGTVAVGPLRGQHTCQQIQPAQVIPGLFRSGLIQLQPEGKMRKRHHRRIRDIPAVDRGNMAHHGTEAGFQLLLLHQVGSFRETVFPEQTAHLGHNTGQVRRLRRFFPFWLIKQFMGKGDSLSIRISGHVRTLDTVSGHEYFPAGFGGEKAADTALRQERLPLFQGKWIIGIFNRNDLMRIHSFRPFSEKSRFPCIDYQKL